MIDIFWQYIPVAGLQWQWQNVQRKTLRRVVLFYNSSQGNQCSNNVSQPDMTQYRHGAASLKSIK